MPYAPENNDIWIDDTLSEIKYRINDKNRSLHPTPWYTSGEQIEAGRLVSLCDEAWHTASSKTVGKVYYTDSQYIDKCLGIALNGTTGPDQPIEVLSWGVYKFSTPKFSASEIGKMAYVKVSPDGDFTTIRNDATLGGNTLIEVGTVVSTTELLVSFEGDSRGPAGITEIEYITGAAVLTDSSNNPVLMAQAYETSDGKEVGKVYTADKRKTTRKTTIAGFIIGSDHPNFGTASVVPAGSKLICQRQGLVKGFTGLVPGEPVFAATNGAITQNLASLNFYTDAICPVGIAYSATEVLVNIESSIYNIDTAAIGAIIALPPTGTPDYGYLKCEGQVLNAVTNPEYQDLYNVVGNTWGGTDNTNFELPNLSAIETTGFQIKYKLFYQAIPQDAPVFRIDTDWAAYNAATPYVDVNINAWGEAFNLDEAVVKIFIKNGTTEARCIEPSTSVYTYVNVGATYYKYGFQAIKLDSDPDHIRIKFATDGLAYLNDSGVWTSANGWQYKVVIYKAEKWNRFIDITAETKLNTLFSLALMTRNKLATDKYAGEMDRGTVDPTNTNRLNYDGDFYVSNLKASGNLYAKGQEVVLNNEAVPTDANANLAGLRVKGTTDKTILWKDIDDSWHMNQGLKIESDDGNTVSIFLDNDTGNITTLGNVSFQGTLGINSPALENIWAKYSAEAIGDSPRRANALFYENVYINGFSGWSPSNATFSAGRLSASGPNSSISKAVAGSGATYPYVKIKFRLVSPQATSQITITSAVSAGSPDTITLPIAQHYDWQVVAVDMGAPWNASTLSGVTVAFNNAAGNIIDFAFIYIGGADAKDIPALINGVALADRELTKGTYVGPYASRGLMERAFRFSSAWNSFLRSKNATHGFTDGDFTLHFIAKPTSISVAQALIAYGSGTTIGFDIRTDTSGKLVVSFKDNTTPTTYTTTNPLFSTSEYRIIDVVVDRANSKLRIYKTGVLFQEFTGITIPAGCTGIDSGGYSLTLGASATSTLPYDGTIEDIQIYTKALTIEELKSLIHTPKIPSNSSVRYAGKFFVNDEFFQVRNLLTDDSIVLGPTTDVESGKGLRVYDRSIYLDKNSNGNKLYIRDMAATSVPPAIEWYGNSGATKLAGLWVDGSGLYVSAGTGSTAMFAMNTNVATFAEGTTAGQWPGYVKVGKLRDSTLSPHVAIAYNVGTPQTKFFRVNASAALEVVNSNYTETILTLADNGNMTGVAAASISGFGKVYNAVWNDVADFVEIDKEFIGEPGEALVRTPDGKVRRSFKHAQKGSLGIYSDTYGLSAGHDSSKKQIAIAVGGFVLARVFGQLVAGDPLVSSKHGYLEKATWFDRIFRQDRILAIFDRIETSRVWPTNGDPKAVYVDNRCWVKVK